MGDQPTYATIVAVSFNNQVTSSVLVAQCIKTVNLETQFYSPHWNDTLLNFYSRPMFFFPSISFLPTFPYTENFMNETESYGQRRDEKIENF